MPYYTCGPRGNAASARPRLSAPQTPAWLIVHVCECKCAFTCVCKCVCVCVYVCLFMCVHVSVCLKWKRRMERTSNPTTHPPSLIRFSTLRSPASSHHPHTPYSLNPYHPLHQHPHVPAPVPAPPSIIIHVPTLVTACPSTPTPAPAPSPTPTRPHTHLLLHAWVPLVVRCVRHPRGGLTVS
jgi:hypothetical protein